MFLLNHQTNTQFTVLGVKDAKPYFKPRYLATERFECEDEYDLGALELSLSKIEAVEAVLCDTRK